LAISLTTLFITGLVRQDAFIALTRGFTLVFVIFVHASIKNPGKVMTWRQYRFPIITLFTVIFVGGTLWFEALEFQEYLTKQQYALNVVNAGVVITGILFMVYGQEATAKQIWDDFRGGKLDLEGFIVQLFRFTNFALQMTIYTMLFGLLDSIFITSALGAFGALRILRSYVWRYFFPRREVIPV
jgi:hypothetical protein